MLAAEASLLSAGAEPDRGDDPRTLATLPTAGRTLAALSGSPLLLTPLSDSHMRRIAQNIWLSLIDRTSYKFVAFVS